MSKLQHLRKYSSTVIAVLVYSTQPGLKDEMEVNYWFIDFTANLRTLLMAQVTKHRTVWIFKD